MKKFYYILALAVAALFTACSNDSDYSSPEFPKKNSELKVFVGGIDLRSTRGCDVNGNMWPSLPEYPTDEEKAGVMEYIGSQVNPTSVAWPGWTYYYVQHVDGAHKKYEYTDWNGSKHDNIDGTASMEFMQVLENSGNWQHVYNFNAGKCDNAATHNAALMTDGFNGAKTLNEYSSSTINAWCIFKWNGNYYLGFDFSAKKGDGEIPGDGVFDDWVVKILPGKGEVDPTPDPQPDPQPTPDPQPDPQPTPDPQPAKTGEVEFDVHQQEHKDWNEIKTSIHLRDTVNTRIFIPIPEEYQAESDDFDIRTGGDYTYVSETINSKFNIVGNEYTVEVQINHLPTGVEILINGAECAKALKDARGVYDDGLTFEIHSYVKPSATPAQIWAWLKETKCLQTSMVKWPKDGGCITHTYGQVTSAYYPEERIDLAKDPEK